MFFTILQAAIIFSYLALATENPVKESKTCKEYILPLKVTSLNFIWGLPKAQTNYDATAFNNGLARWDANVTLNPISGGAEVNATYKISGTFCTPNHGRNGVVLIATHGFGFDRSCWDPKIEPAKYSFVDHAIAKGYSVFYYDRLGIFKSSIVSGYMAQVSNQFAILKQIVIQARARKFLTLPKKVVLVGHSFGSVVSNVLLASDPSIVDGTILTGIGYNVPDTAVAFSAWAPRLARIQSPAKWHHPDGGYVGLIYGRMLFFKAPFYDTNVIEYAEANKKPFSLLEVVTLSITDRRAPNFTGPVMVMSGEYDLVFCNGNCRGILEPPIKNVFPASKDLDVYIQPESGHGINLSVSIN